MTFQRHTLYSLLLAAMANPSVSAPDMEEVTVSARHDSRSIDVADELVISPDVAQLLKKAPGANVNSNGPLTGIPQYRGMFGPRVATSLDGSQLAPSGPNWMDPPLSYAVGGQLQSLEVYRGIAPVSIAQESIGGAVVAKADRGQFTTSDEVTIGGRVLGSAQSVNSGYHLNASVDASNRHHRLHLAAMTEGGDDAEFADGDIIPSEYQRQRYALAYGWRQGDHQLQLDYGYNDTGESGTASLPMDIDYFDGDLYRLGYRYTPANALQWEATVFGSDLEHGMTNYHLRQAPADGARWRRNIAASDSLGFDLKGRLVDSSGSWAAGIDGFSAEHDSDIDNPNNDMFFVDNFNGAERDILGAYLERQQDWGSQWRGEFGLRYNHVSMDAGEVNGTPAMMMPPAAALRDAFNAADREQNDDNIDLVAKAWYQASPGLALYLGAAQKHRSPSYQERYLWLPLEATGGLADGYTYTGNIELDPEVARQLELGFDLAGSHFSLSPRLFYSRVDDYIQGTPSEVAAAVMFVRMMNAMDGGSRPDPLQFNNVEASLYGFDMDWAWQLSANWSLSGIVNYVRGKREDISDDLYRIAPPNNTLRLTYAASNWSASLENVVYARQDKVSTTNGEKETAGYGVINLAASWQLSPQLQLAAGVDNLFDKVYRDHLGGYNRAANPDIARGERLPGYGTNVFARVSYNF